MKLLVIILLKRALINVITNFSHTHFIFQFTFFTRGLYTEPSDDTMVKNLKKLFRLIRETSQEFVKVFRHITCSQHKPTEQRTEIKRI